MAAEERRTGSGFRGRLVAVAAGSGSFLTWGVMLVLCVSVCGWPGAQGKECEKRCVHGNCSAAGGQCVCQAGWVGELCQHCGGRFKCDQT